MTWFGVSIVSVIEFREGVQSEFPVFEDIYLFEAKSDEELQDKVKSQMQIIDAAGECSYCDRPAVLRCVGVRKIRSVYREASPDQEGPPGDRSEISHSFFISSSKEDVDLFTAGKAVTLRCVDDAEEA